MDHRASRRDHRRYVWQFAGLLLCLGLAIGTRLLVVRVDLDDAAAVVLQAGVLGVLATPVLTLAARALRQRRMSPRLVPSLLFAGFAIAAAGYALSSYVDLSVALHAVLSHPETTRTEMSLGPEGRDVRLAGELSEGTAARLSGLLAAHPTVSRIHLTSEGGLVDEGDALRRVIAAHGLTTFVPDYCVSACTLAFLGGRERLVVREARLGFHAPFEQGLLGQTFTGDDGTERAIYAAAGIAPDFMEKALAVAPSDVWIPGVDQLLAAHVATAVVDRYRFPDSSLDGVATLPGTRDMLMRNFALTRVLRQSRPEAVDAIAQWYLSAYRRGLSEGRIVEGLTSLVGTAVSAVMAEADEDTLFALGRFLDAAMRAARSDADCLALGAKADLVRGEAVLDQDAIETNDRHTSDARIVDAHVKENQVSDGKPDEVAVDLLERALRTHRPLFVGRSIALHAADLLPSRTGGACAPLRDLYATILRLSRHDAAAVIRTMSMRSAADLPTEIAIAGPSR